MIRLADCSDMTLAVYHGRNTTTQQHINSVMFFPFQNNPNLDFGVKNLSPFTITEEQFLSLGLVFKKRTCSEMQIIVLSLKN